MAGCSRTRPRDPAHTHRPDRERDPDMDPRPQGRGYAHAAHEVRWAGLDELPQQCDWLHPLRHSSKTCILVSENSGVWVEVRAYLGYAKRYSLHGRHQVMNPRGPLRSQPPLLRDSGVR
ncbi:hypothetical protein VTG60DRAFT_648 [Thermothelomyces hinnuleus]